MVNPSAKETHTVSLRRFLPREHGSWSLALEPLVLGCLAAPSTAGFALALATVSAFLARRPLQLRSSAPGARAVFGVLAAVAGAGLVAAALLAGSALFIALAPAAVAGAAFLAYDLRKDGREQVAELAGAAAFACVPVALGRCAGAGWGASAVLGALALARSIPAVMVVRACLRRRKGKYESGAAAVAASFTAVTIGAALAWQGRAPLLVPVALILLLARAGWLLRPGVALASARRIGIGEAVTGVIYVIAIGLVMNPQIP